MKITLLVAFLACAAVMIVQRNFSSLQGTDFPDFYCASRMLLDGHGSRLYDSAWQYRYQAQYAGRIGTLFIHPPFEAILYLSVAWLPLKDAFSLWTCLNLLLLAVASHSLTQVTSPARRWQMPTILALTFVPVLLCLIQGQDSIVLLLLLTLAYVDLRRERNFSAGCWLALGLFKFQLVLPILLVLLLVMRGTPRRALASGFGMVTIALAGLSAAASGWSVFFTYPKFLAHLPSQRFSGIIPSAMPNFRGLAFLLFHRDQSSANIAVVLILSTITLIAVWYAGKQAQAASNLSATHDGAAFDLAFSDGVIFSVLVSFHLNPHDLTLLLLPISLTLPRVLARKESTTNDQSHQPTFRWSLSNWPVLISIAILFLPPLHLLALEAHLFPYALLAIPTILLFVAIAFARRGRRTPEIALHVDHG